MGLSQKVDEISQKLEAWGILQFNEGHTMTVILGSLETDGIQSDPQTTITIGNNWSDNVVY